MALVVNTVEKLLLAAPRGYCAGVDRAVQTVERALEIHGAPVYVRKEIVHNKYVVEQLRARGAIFVNEQTEVPEGAVCVFSAHGIAPSVRAGALERGLRTIDATCPLVTKVHREAARFAEEGYTIVLVGHDGHEEVEGTMGEAPERIVLVENEADVDALEVDDPDRVAYITQTTLAVDETSAIIARLRERFPRIVGPRTDDICYATTNRQAAVKQMASLCDLMLVIGSRNSSNSVRLVEVARDCGTDAHLIDRAREVREEWLEDRRVVGISSGASAPENLVQDLVELFRLRGVQDISEFHVIREDVRFMLPKPIREACPHPAHRHLRPAPGQRLGADLLRRPELRAPLLEAVADADRLVLLGDVLELRHGPARDALAVARPFFEDLGRALAGCDLVVTAGNHDHALIEPWLARRSEEDEPAPLGVEQLLHPAQVSPMLARIAEWAAPTRVVVAYPGLWLRPDVYATHGHYLDCHLTVPTLERLSVGAMSRALGRPARGFDGVEDYEAVTSPVFAWRDAVARDGQTGNALNGVATIAAWHALGGGDAVAAMRSTERLRAGPAQDRGRAAPAQDGAPAPPWKAAHARSSAPSRSRLPPSTAPVSDRFTRTSQATSCVARDSGRWARWPHGSASATPTWSSATPTAPVRFRAIASRSGALHPRPPRAARARAW